MNFINWDQELINLFIQQSINHIQVMLVLQGIDLPMPHIIEKLILMPLILLQYDEIKGRYIEEFVVANFLNREIFYNTSAYGSITTINGLQGEMSFLLLIT
jgi:hypothetical protein